MRDLTNQSRIWKFVGSVSAINGLVCFALSSTYKMSFGKWGFRGLLAYLFVGLFMLFLMLRAKRIRVSQKVQGVVAALIFDLICLISVLHDKLETGKSDAMSIISYGSFALMSLSMSRKFELGFETGFSSFFLSLFVAHLCKINWNLLPVALLFCSAIIILRHYSESGVQFASISPYHLGHPNTAVIEIGHEGINVETQDSPGTGQVSEEIILEKEQNNEPEEDLSSFPAESSNKYHVSSGNNMLTIQNGWMQSSGEPELISSAPPLDCGGATQLNMWRFQVSDGTHSINPRLMYDPVRRIWLCLKEAELVFRMVEEADLELTMRPEMRIFVKPQAANSADDLRTSSPTSVLQLREDAETEEEEEEEPVEKCQDVTRT